MNKKTNFTTSSFIENIYQDSDNIVSLEYCDDIDSYIISCLLNWTKDQKDEFIDRINNYHNDLKSLPKYMEEETKKIFTKYFGDSRKILFAEQLVQRSLRLNKLYDIGAPKIITNNELQLIIILLIINLFAQKDSISIKVTSD